MIRQALYLAALLTSLVGAEPLMAEDALRRDFVCPPDAAKAWGYWWWLNGAANKEGITRDFEEMKKQGISGALLFDAGEAGPDAPRGPHFMSPEWRELYKHALREADRCGIDSHQTRKALAERRPMASRCCPVPALKMKCPVRRRTVGHRAVAFEKKGSGTICAKHPEGRFPANGS